ncbi:MAG: S26 family signal peptidase [Methylocystis sp.]|nr:S26 family signal peptidase [Methylocystis sp.]
MTGRAATLAAMCLGISAAALPQQNHGVRWLIWNVSASAPVGLYSVAPAGKLHVTDLMVIRPPDPIASFLADRGYLPRGVPLLKRILTLPGQTVCRQNFLITVDGVEVGTAREHDHLGRALPVWQGCRIIAEDAVFLMNWQSEDSLDGRYFGPLPSASIIGRVIPLWTFEDN